MSDAGRPIPYVWEGFAVGQTVGIPSGDVGKIECFDIRYDGRAYAVVETDDGRRYSIPMSGLVWL